MQVCDMTGLIVQYLCTNGNLAFCRLHENKVYSGYKINNDEIHTCNY